MSPRLVAAGGGLAVFIALASALSPVPHAAQGTAQGAAAGQDSQAKGDSQDKQRTERRRGDRVRGDDLEAAGDRDDAPRRGGTPMPPEMRAKVLAVATDVSPELGEKLQKAFDAMGPDDAVRALPQNARRLMALVVLKERNPDLYQTRVEDLRLQLELHALGGKYQAAQAANDQAAMQRLDGEISVQARRQVAAELKARGQELKALADQLDRMKSELLTETQQQDARVAERIEAVKAGQPLRPRPLPGEDGTRGDGVGLRGETRGGGAVAPKPPASR